jgi:putative MATE family efflux protein
MKPDPTLLTEGPIGKTLVTFTMPILLGNILQSLNGSVNSVWVGRFLGEAALTATANANSVLFLLLGGVFGVSMAATILVAQYIGARDLDAARRVVGTSAVFFASVSTVIAVVGWLTAPWLLGAMHTPSAAVPYATDYLRIIFIAMPFIYIYAFLMAALRGAGDSRTPFKFLLLSVGIDIALNPLLIFGLGPIPPLGIAGSAIATLIANAVALTALVVSLYRSGHSLCLRGADIRYLRLDGAIMGTLLKKGLPMGLQLLLISANAFALVTLVNRFGTDTTAAYGATWQLWTYLQMPAFAIGAAVSSMAAQNVGAGRWDRVGRIAGAGIGLHVVLTGGLLGLLLLLNAPALHLFLPTGNALEAAAHINVTGAWSFMFFGVSMVLFGIVRSTGAVFAPVIALCIALWGVRIPFAVMLAPRLGADAIWWSFPIAAFVSASLAIVYYRFGSWRNARMMPSRPTTAPTPPEPTTDGSAQ